MTASDTTIASPNKRVQRRKYVVVEQRKAWLYVIPVALVFTIVFVGPLIQTFWTAMHETKYFELAEFSGLNAFADLFSDRELGSQIRTTIIFSLGSLIVALPMGLVSAIVLNSITRATKLVRSLFLLPWLMSQATAGTIWLWFLNPNYGPASYITQKLGFGPTDLFSNPNTALVGVILITVWWSYPQAMLLFLGALQTVPVELKEGLVMDGGNRWQSFRYVTFPYIQNTIVSAVVILLMLYVQMVTIILVTTRGGPLIATETLAMRVYNQTFFDYDLQGASATAILLFVFNIVLTVFALKFRRKESL